MLSNSKDHWWPESFLEASAGWVCCSVYLVTWRITPLSKWLVTPTYKPFRPLEGEQPYLRDLLTMVFSHLLNGVTRQVHPGKLAWNPKTEVRQKMMVLFNWMIFMFHINFPGCTYFKTVSICFISLSCFVKNSSCAFANLGILTPNP